MRQVPLKQSSFTASLTIPGVGVNGVVGTYGVDDVQIMAWLTSRIRIVFLGTFCGTSSCR